MQTVLDLLWHYLGGRRGFVALTVVVVTAGMGFYLRVGQLAGVGIAPSLLLLTHAPQCAHSACA